MPHSLVAISPLDGRYGHKIEDLKEMVSEAALIKQRINVELQWLLFLSKQKDFHERLTPGDHEALQQFQRDWNKGSFTDCSEAVKNIEKTTNHDIKAVEYWLHETLSHYGAQPQLLSFIHFACTSDDINNLSYALMIKQALELSILPHMKGIIKTLAELSRVHAERPMLARTHGQAASPTTVGKEFAVFGHRLLKQLNKLEALSLEGKINGAVGNFNAHHFTLPHLDWEKLARTFVTETLQLQYNPLTTQIENHDTIAEFCNHLKLWNTIAIDLSRDIWYYMSLLYLGQKKKSNEVGSSTMPHKINPIDFENAEGNYGLSSSLANHMSEKLPISRMQRDLSDSTVMRSIGSVLGYHLIAQKSLASGLAKMTVNPEPIANDLSLHPEVLAEAIQTSMRFYGNNQAYEQLKQLTRGQKMDAQQLQEFIEQQRELPATAKAQLMALKPHQYSGIAAHLALSFSQEVEKQFP